MKKVYKLNGTTRSSSGGGRKNENGPIKSEKISAGEDDEKELEMQILGAMALKGAS